MFTDLDLLVEAGPNKRRKTTGTRGDSTLVSACCDGKTAVAAALLNILNVDSCGTSQKRTLLMLASDHGHAEIVAKLLELKADVDARDLDQSTSLILACANGHKSVVDQLIASGADIDASNLAKWTALIAVHKL
jgi:ankyrin repeat protein